MTISDFVLNKWVWIYLQKPTKVRIAEVEESIDFLRITLKNKNNRYIKNPTTYNNTWRIYQVFKTKADCINDWKRHKNSYNEHV